MALKRTYSSGSETDYNNKKTNLQTTPEKITEFSHWDIMPDIMEQETQREEAINAVKKSAPEWFAGVFNFLLKDLDYLRTQAKGVEQYKEICDNNTREITKLETRVKELEEANLKLNNDVTKLEDYSRKNNLIVKGIPESGPKENIKEVVIDFFKHNLKLVNFDESGIDDTHRLGKPPHQVPTPTKKPRDVIVRFQSSEQRMLAWNNRSKLKNSKFVLSEHFSPQTQEKIDKLLPFFKAARQHPDVTRCQLNKDVLVINGQKFSVDYIGSLPFGLSSVNPSERLSKNQKRIGFFGKSSFMSNFHDSSFEENGTVYKTVEHYYQYKTATYFKDDTTANRILLAKSPLQAKALSHQIKDYDAELWKPVACHTMQKAVLMKFQQNPRLADKLKQTTGIIVEANPKDQVFSCGLSLKHPGREDETKWTGENILGQILCQVRDTL